MPNQLIQASPWCMKNKHSGKITRRRFLRSSTAAGLVLTPFHSLLSVKNTDRGSTKSIVVIGAGLSGISCGYELVQHGYDVTVLEARSRPGGRVRTYRDPFADNLYAEMGGEYVDKSDQFVRSYCDKFGLEVLPAKQYDGIYLRGKRYVMADFKQYKQALPFAGTEGGNLFGQEYPYIEKWVNMIKSIDDLPKKVLDLDNISVAELLKRGGAPKDVVELYTYTNATESTALPKNMSALSMVLANFQASAFSENTVEGRIFGGNDQLAKKFAKMIAANVHYNCPVRKIKHSKDEIEVFFEESGRKTSIKGDRCVITMPVSMLRRTAIEPYFSDDKMHCIREQSYGHVMKIAMQFKRRIWDEPGSIGQRVFTDTPLRRVYHHSIDQPGPRGILLSFTSGADAMKLGRMPENRRLKVARDTAAKLWPNTQKTWESGISKYWNEDPWLRASYSIAGLGQKDFRDILKRPEGRVHFAGEHTSIYRASMNGAIESGVRASQEIIETGN